jgi:hypothetical protein
MSFSGRLSTTHKKMLARWRVELGCLANGKGDFSEEEQEEEEEGGGGIFSPEMASSCSSRDTGLGSVSEILSDDDHSSVISVNLESRTSCAKEQSGKASCYCFKSSVFKPLVAHGSPPDATQLVSNG